MAVFSPIRELPALRLVNRRTQEYCGPCPICGGNARSDRFRVWLTPERKRYWCRRCDAKGSLDTLLQVDRPRIELPTPAQKPQRQIDPNPAHAAHYRELYAAVALWAHANLWDTCNPDPLAYLHGRGLHDATIGAALLGYALHDPTSLPDYLRQTCPALLPYAEAAGVLVRRDSTLRTHPNLCGRIVLPYVAHGEVTDLRTRAFPGKGYTSLAGGYSERGATALFGWDALDGATSVLITEGEFKALAVTAAYADNHLSAPALAHPGLSYWRDEWATELREAGVQSVVLAYDSQPRPVHEGQQHLAPEEIWTIRHGLKLQAAGLQVRVLRLPLVGGATKADLDEFLMQQGAQVLERLISAAPALTEYHASLPRPLLDAAKLPSPMSYPRHRARPQAREPRGLETFGVAPTLAQVREQIPAMVQAHVSEGQGFLVLAHPPGAGKGYGTTHGLQQYLHAHPTPGQIVWSAQRKDQLTDQQGLPLIPLHGRNDGNCRKLAEAQTLVSKGYAVRASLCQRRCPHVNNCTYLRQFGQEGDLFAPQPLLLATNWWQDAGVLVLDEFDPARLAQTITLTTQDLVTLHRATACRHAQAVLHWLLQCVGTSAACSLRGSVLLSTMQQAAARDGLSFHDTLRAAVAALPSAEDQARLTGLPYGATLADYAALPSGHLPRLLTVLDREARLQFSGQLFTSRLEISDGRLLLFIRHDHLIAQLARPEQPKILLDATINERLLRALFPHTPIQVERLPFAQQIPVRQVLRADWAKSTLRGARREEWYSVVAAHIDPTRDTLVVCTQECAVDLREALAKRGLQKVEVKHYGALRGSNAYKGYDVVLAQVYHPNTEAIIREGRALFAGMGEPLNEQLGSCERLLTDSQGNQWAIQVADFADPRLAALLELRREAEMVQTALRGRPLDHPEARITLLFSLPLPGLTPTEVIDAPPTPTSNGGRQAKALLGLIASTRQLLAQRSQAISVTDLVSATGMSESTVRKYWAEIAEALALNTTVVQTIGSNNQTYQRAVLIPPPTSMDHADDQDSIICAIHASEPPQPAPASTDAPLADGKTSAPFGHEIRRSPPRASFSPAAPLRYAPRRGQTPGQQLWLPPESGHI
jgi:hypothetical protein